MAEMEKQTARVVQEANGGGGGEEEERLLEGMAVVDFDMLCSTVALQTNGRWGMLGGAEGEEEVTEFGGVFRMWEVNFSIALKTVESPLNPLVVLATDLGRT